MRLVEEMVELFTFLEFLKYSEPTEKTRKGFSSVR